jgi:hypothetical protein
LKTPRLFRFQQKFPDHDCEIISEKPTPFDLWSEWAEKPFDCMLTIDADGCARRSETPMGLD